MNLGEYELLYLSQAETTVASTVPGIVYFMEQTDTFLGTLYAAIDLNNAVSYISTGKGNQKLLHLASGANSIVLDILPQDYINSFVHCNNIAHKRS